MQNEGSGAPMHQGDQDGDVLSTAELRGQEYKRVLRAAAALNGMFTDSAIAKVVGIGRAAVGNWWMGSRPEPPQALRLAKATGIPKDELFSYLYEDGPPPALPEPGSVARASVEAGAQRGRRRQQRRVQDRPSPRPPRRPPGTDE